MRVFISWSGDRSKELATALCEWLRRVIQRSEPWMSVGGIAPGRRWGLELAEQLESTDFGIICVTRENKHAPWLMFEAGALSKKGFARVVPFLLGMEMRELKAPLDQFQALSVNRDDTFRMVQSINAALPEQRLLESDLIAIFDTWWPRLEEKISAIPPSDLPKPEPPSGDDLSRLILEKLDKLEVEPIVVPTKHGPWMRIPLFEDDTPPVDFELLSKIGLGNPFSHRLGPATTERLIDLLAKGLISEVYKEDRGSVTQQGYAVTPKGLELLQRHGFGPRP